MLCISCLVASIDYTSTFFFVVVRDEVVSLFAVCIFLHASAFHLFSPDEQK